MFHVGYGYQAHDGIARLFFFLLLLAVAAAAVTAIVLLVRDRHGAARTASSGAETAPPGVSGATNAMRILDDRYAKGEIDDEEYQRRRTLLRSP